MRKLGERARHVIGRGDDNERVEAVFERPTPGFDRVAKRIASGIVEVDAAGQQSVVVDDLPGNLAGRRAGVDPGDEQALAAAGGEQFKRVGDARGAAGQHHDSVGVAIEHDLAARQQPDESHKAEYERDAAQDGESDGNRPDAPRSDGGPKAQHRFARPPRHVSFR